MEEQKPGHTDQKNVSMLAGHSSIFWSQKGKLFGNDVINIRKMQSESVFVLEILNR